MAFSIADNGGDSAGAFLPTEGATTTLEPLIFTTKNSNLMSAFDIAQQPIYLRVSWLQ